MSNENYDEKFNERRKLIFEQGKREYEEVYKRMVNKLQASHLEPLSKILLEKAGYPLNCDLAIDDLKAQLLQNLCEAWNENIWEDAADKLTQLHMCNENVRGHDVKSLNIKTKSAEESMLPLLMRYKAKRLEFLKKQVERQTKAIEELSAEAISRREVLRSVEAKCLMLNEAVLEKIKNHEKDHEELTEEFTKLLRGNNDDVFTAKPKVKEEF